MSSIRRQLIFRLMISALTVEAIAGGTLYFIVRSSLRTAQDAEVLAKAHSIAAAVVIDEGHVSFHPPALRGSAHLKDFGSSVYAIWDDAGAVFAASPGINPSDLARRHVDKAYGLTLPGSIDARAISLKFSPQPADDEASATTEPVNNREFTLVLAEDAHAIDRPLRILLTTMVAIAALTALGVGVMVTTIVRRALRPLDELARAAAGLDISAIDHRFPVDQFALELAPICQRLNELLGKLDAAFQRERRFTSDVAHELRTPISELRSSAEVATKWPGDAEASAVFANDALSIARQMENTVGALFRLARSQAQLELAEIEEIDLSALVCRTWQRFQLDADEAALSVALDIAPATMARTDAGLMQSILNNVFSNAIEYSPRRGKVKIELRADGGDVAVTVTNSNTVLAADDIPRLFEAFWRKDASRTDSSHSGLGLSLVAEYARIARAQVNACLTADGDFQISLRVPLAATREALQLA